MFNSQYEELIYLAGQAPAEPQPWFKPDMAGNPKPPQSIWVSEDGKHKYTSRYAAEQAEGEDYCLSNQQEVCDWDENYRKQRYVQWPLAWARVIRATIQE